MDTAGYYIEITDAYESDVNDGDDLSQVRWNHRPAPLHAALQRFGGMAGLEAPLAPPRGPHGSIHGDCAQRIQLGGAGRKERILRCAVY
jgi:hypothetical protein